MAQKHCPERIQLFKLTQLDKPLPAKFMEHACHCDECMRWTTYAFAVQEVLNKTGRLLKNKDCPIKPLFYSLILLAVRSADEGQKVNRNVISLNPNEELEISILPWVIDDHLNSQSSAYCRFCRNYYDKVFDEVEKVRKRYEASIRAGEEVRPVVKDTAEEVDASEIGYDPYDEKHKPV